MKPSRSPARSANRSVIVGSLAASAASLADHDPQRARALLRESIEIRAALGYEQTFESTQAVLVASRIGDWTLTLELASRSIRGLHWLGDEPLCAGILNVVARAVASSDPEGAAVIQGGARGLLEADSAPSPHRIRPPVLLVVRPHHRATPAS